MGPLNHVAYFNRLFRLVTFDGCRSSSKYLNNWFLIHLLSANLAGLASQPCFLPIVSKIQALFIHIMQMAGLNAAFLILLS